jgi:hypothetical protein
MDPTKVSVGWACRLLGSFILAFQRCLPRQASIYQLRRPRMF